jgi:hypothetical protein
LRRSVADELGAAHRADLDEVSAGEDLVVWSIVARFRAALRAALIWTMSSGITLVRLLYQRVLEKAFGASPPRRSGGPLDAVRLARVSDFIEAHLARSSRSSGFQMSRRSAHSTF